MGMDKREDMRGGVCFVMYIKRWIEAIERGVDIRGRYGTGDTYQR